MGGSSGFGWGSPFLFVKKGPYYVQEDYYL